jgi:hypothetical protein
MTAEQFAYWMQGFVELHGEPPTAEQWAAIKDHLGLVFNKVTPLRAPYVRTDDLPRQPSDASPAWPYQPRTLGPLPPSPLVTTCVAVARADESILTYC